MNVETGTESPIFLFREYLFRNFGILSLQSGPQSTYIHSVCPLVGIGTPPNPSSASECAPPAPLNQRVGAHSPADEGGGGVQIPTTGEKA
jgi:hypothetical protein